MIALLVFLIGLFIGSFLNVVIDRLPRGEGFFFGRSHCDFCHHPLAWYDLLPLFSFLFLRGRCRYCHRFIGWKYPVIELTTGILFALTSFVISASPWIIFLTLSVISCLLIIFFIDMFSGLIPDAILIVLGLSALIRIYILRLSPLPFFAAAGGAFLLFLILFLATRKKGIGFGDVKYAFVMGLLVGYPAIIPALYLAFLTGAGVALILVLARKKGIKSTISFGPFLVLGTIASLFWGTPLWELLQRILGI